ncbi:hypothetical protein PR003_g19708 [Phytophthora rubi]|uniref:HTH CENPB-type domain-containing protein n=1 Tax=Phytophthora rubi TaxID=129364 RepID=A0A6A4DQP6_9STRA|nr:hypothetical protein PR002_g19073 [Phytophthora rubi]KAE9312659.1 hypothetical protein PR003_g19708 [Phytophthora rubi]
MAYRTGGASACTMTIQLLMKLCLSYVSTPACPKLTEGWVLTCTNSWTRIMPRRRCWRGAK